MTLFEVLLEDPNARPKVYISGPISIGDRWHNLHRSFQAHKALIDAGFAPLNPILTMLVPWAEDVPHDVWMDCDLPWVAASDAVLRIPGESEGADTEVKYAYESGIPVFTNLADLKDHFHAEC